MCTHTQPTKIGSELPNESQHQTTVETVGSETLFFSSGVAKLIGNKSGASGGHCPRGKSVAENDTNTEENSGKKGQGQTPDNIV